MKKAFPILFAALAAGALLGASPSVAQNAKKDAKTNGAAKTSAPKQKAAKEQPAENGGHLGTFGDWEAFADLREGFCYAGSKPTRQEGKYTQRGDAFLLVTHRPKEKTFDVVSIEAGYVYKDGSEVQAAVDGKAHALFGQGGQAWARDAAGDVQLVKAMRAGSTLVVKGTSAKGTLTTDTYSLSGVSAALDAINKACPRK
ncbi:MAG: hypothetical protein FJX42_01025 [Alphaproteobacteria bacterium]|nr:hypothetical protein [Alphaproteobacteria bacterium]